MKNGNFEAFHSTFFFCNFAHVFRFCSSIIFFIQKVRSLDQFLRYYLRG